MSAAVTMKRMAKASPRLKARIAGALYLLSVLTAAFTELFVRGSLNIAGGLIAVAGVVAVTLFLYDLLKPVNRGLSVLAASFSLVGASFEALRLQAQGVNIAIVFNGVYCLLIGYLIFRSNFLPRILGALMAFAGLGWLTFLSTPLANHLSPYNLASGLLGEGSVFLWLLVMGVTFNDGRSRPAQPGMAMVSAPPRYFWHTAHRAASLAHVLCAVHRLRVHIPSTATIIPRFITQDRRTFSPEYPAPDIDDFSGYYEFGSAMRTGRRRSFP